MKETEADFNIELIDKQEYLKAIVASQIDKNDQFRKSYHLSGVDFYNIYSYFITHTYHEKIPAIGDQEKLLSKVVVSDYLKHVDAVELEFKFIKGRIFICSTDYSIIIPCLPLTFNYDRFWVQPLLINSSSFEIYRPHLGKENVSINFDLSFFWILNGFIKTQPRSEKIHAPYRQTLEKILDSKHSHQILNDLIVAQHLNEDQRFEAHFEFGLINYMSYLTLARNGHISYSPEIFINLLLFGYKGGKGSPFYFRFVNTTLEVIGLKKIKNFLMEYFSSLVKSCSFFDVNQLSEMIDFYQKGALNNKMELLYIIDHNFELYNSKYSYAGFEILLYSNIDNKNNRKEELSKLKEYLRSVKNNLGKSGRKIENEMRASFGFNNVGMFIKETSLYRKLEEALPEFDIVPQGSPKWLGNQRLDIYFPELNIGIEYQGEQHFRPVEIFGGEEAFQKKLERDAAKSEKCLKNGCQLFYVNYDEDMGFAIERLVGIVKSTSKT